MPAPSPFRAFLEPLETLGLPYCVTGSVAASVYGEPRLTADIDVALLLKAEDMPALRAAFPESAYYVPPDREIASALVRGGMFNLIHHASQFKAHFYLAAADPLHPWALAHRRRVDVPGDGAWIAPPEYVVLRKLQYFREGRSDKHLRDIRYIVAATPIDRPFLESHIARLGLADAWRECLGSAGG